MASQRYTKANERFMVGEIDLLDDTIKAVLVDGSDYTPDFDTDEFIDDIPGGAVVGTAATLASKSVTGGVFDCAPITFTAPSGDPCEHLALYKDTGTPATSPLIALLDIPTATPNGVSNHTFTPTGANKLFKL